MGIRIFASKHLESSRCRAEDVLVVDGAVGAGEANVTRGTPKSEKHADEGDGEPPLAVAGTENEPEETTSAESRKWSRW